MLRKETRARLVALAPDASAQRAARVTVHPLLAEVEKLIPRPARKGVLALHGGGLARHKARRATAAAGDGPSNPSPLHRALVGVQPAFPCRTPSRATSNGRARVAGDGDELPSLVHL